MKIINRNSVNILAALLMVTGVASCKKMVSIPPPINSITTEEVFSTDEQANAAMAGVYTRLINGDGQPNSGYTSFCTGLTTLLTGLSSDELVYGHKTNTLIYKYNTNKLLRDDVSSIPLWKSAYDAIYGCNAIIEGAAASTSGAFHEAARKTVTGEAKFVRAFAYFYLTNLFGDVPMTLTVDFNQTANLVRTAQADVYKQVIKDLKDAAGLLAEDYSAGMGERVRPNKWAATALLARVYLYTGNYADAVSSSTAVINNASLFLLEGNLNQVFSANSNEAIWQLQQNTSMAQLGNATGEGYVLIPNPRNNGKVTFGISSQLLETFAQGDQRKRFWMDSADNKAFGLPGFVYYPFKYKTGIYNASPGAPATEYYMVLRLAEQYLIRAEANAAQNMIAAAITDLNTIRQRAGVPDLPGSLTQYQLVAAVAHERQTELFAEWGHRWFDLKRTGKAHEVLSQITMKQPWLGDYQLLYPIPLIEIIANHNITQNPGY